MLVAYLTRGVKAGLVAGLAFGLLVALVANPLVGYADGLGGDAHAAAGDHGEAGHHHGAATEGGHAESAVSAAVTRAVSVVSGVLWGVLLGGVVFGAGFYFLEPAIPGAGAAKSYLLAGAGFVTFSGAPWLVFPPRPPGVEAALSVDARLALYGGMMVAGALACLAAGWTYGRVREARGRAAATAAAAVSFVALSVPVTLAPANPVESALPADLTTGVTGLVVFGQVLLWVVLGAAHARFRRADAAAAGTGLDGADADADPALAD